MAGETMSPRKRRASQSETYLGSVPSAHELYQKHARHIGRFHGISGMDHLQLSIFFPPPPWKTSDPPISPSHAKRLYDEDFDHALAEDCQRALPDGHVTEEAREREKGEQATAWRARMALNELVREHRCEVWYEWLNLVKREERRKEMAKEIAQKWEREEAMILEKDLTPSPPEPGGVQSPGREKRGGRLRQVPVTTRRLRSRTTENRTPQAVRAGNALMQMSEEERAEGWQPLAPMADIGSNDDMQDLISASMQGAYGRLQNGTEELQRKKQIMERALNAVLSQSQTLPPHSNLPDNPRLQDAGLTSQTYGDEAHQETQVCSQPYAGLGQGASYSGGPGPYSTQRAAIHSILDESTNFGRALTSSEAIGAPSADSRSLSGSSFGPLLSGQVAALYQGTELERSSAAADIIFKPKRKRVHPNTTPRPTRPDWLAEFPTAPPPPTSTISPEALQAGLDWRQQNAATEAAASAILDSASTTPTPKSRGKGKSTARARAPPKPRASRRGANPPINTLIGLPISNAAAKHLVDNGMITERSRREFDADVTPRKGFRLEVGAGPAAILQTSGPESTSQVGSGPSVTSGTDSGFSTRPASGRLASQPPAIQWQTPERMATPRPDASSEMSSAPSESDESPLGKRARRLRLSPW